jgi:pyruvate formate lyase activating enzyme
MREAWFWKKIDGRGVLCELCPHRCEIAENKTGRCGIRRAIAGKLIAEGYGLISSAHADPIEKKPLYHFHPGSRIFSVGGWGCNFKCLFCQNWQISQSVDMNAPRASIADILREARFAGSPGIAYTYNEPLINFEFVLSCAREARSEGMHNVLVTNGYIEEAPAAKLLPYIDALNIDIKSMDDSFYRTQCGGSLAPVLAFAVQARSSGCHVEITNLLIPGLNDGVENAGRLSDWMASNLGRDVPLHLSAYTPEHKMNIPPTPLKSLETACLRCRQKLDYVYIGNVSSGSWQDTLCPRCGRVLISRRGYTARLDGIAGRVCDGCGRAADVVFPG